MVNDHKLVLKTNTMLYRIVYYNKDQEKRNCFLVASSEEEALKIFHYEITDREPESISKCRNDICVITARR